MQNDAACVGTGGIIAKHGQVSYANGAHFPHKFEVTLPVPIFI